MKLEKTSEKENFQSKEKRHYIQRDKDKNVEDLSETYSAERKNCQLYLVLASLKIKGK